VLSTSLTPWSGTLRPLQQQANPSDFRSPRRLVFAIRNSKDVESYLPVLECAAPYDSRDPVWSAFPGRDQEYERGADRVS
jgi:hypothetical protein